MNHIVTLIDREIDQLQTARNILADLAPTGVPAVTAASASLPGKKRGRPAGSKTRSKVSAEARAKLSASMKRRWAERKKTPK